MIRSSITIFLTLFITQLAYGQVGKIKLVGFKQSECEATSIDRLITRIARREIKGDILVLDIATVATCCVKFKPVVSAREGVLYLDIEETGPSCECDCYYILTYEIKGIKDKEVRVKFKDKDIELSAEKYKTYPIKFRILNGDTIDFVDKYGLKQGKWTYLNDSLMLTGYFEALDDVPVKLVRFYPDKSLKSVVSREKVAAKLLDGSSYDAYTNYNHYVEYFESGTKKKECTTADRAESYKTAGRCKEWNEEGVLVYEGVYRE